MSRQQTNRPDRAWGYVRTLIEPEELRLLRDHLMRLDPASRHDRFNGYLDDSFVERYAAKCAADGTIIIAYIVDGIVRGAAELHPPQGDALPEAAFSVEADFRRRGIGTMLFRRLVAEARWKGYERLRITTSAENHAMRALARKFGAHLEFRHGESTGTLNLSRTPEDQWAEIVEAPFAASRALLSFSRTWWRLFYQVLALKPAWTEGGR